MSVKFIDPLDGRDNTKFIRYTSGDGLMNSVHFHHLEDSLASNRIFSKNEIQLYDKISRHGYFPLYDNEQVTKEYLFFTKPDLNIFGDGSELSFKYSEDLNPVLANIPFFVEANIRNKDAIRQLQYSVRDLSGIKNPFMYLLSNPIKSKDPWGQGFEYFIQHFILK